MFIDYLKSEIHEKESLYISYLTSFLMADMSFSLSSLRSVSTIRNGNCYRDTQLCYIDTHFGYIDTLRVNILKPNLVACLQKFKIYRVIML